MAELLTPRLLLRPVARGDATGPYLRWMNDPEVVRWLEARGRTYSVRDLEEFIETHSVAYGFHFFAITMRGDSAHIGNIKLGPVSGRDRRGDLGLIIGEQSAWGKGYAREAIAAVTDHAFSRLGLHKVTAGCYAGNEGSRRAFLAAGFEQEGFRREQFWDGDGWQDEFLFGRRAAL